MNGSNGSTRNYVILAIVVGTVIFFATFHWPTQRNGPHLKITPETDAPVTPPAETSKVTPVEIIHDCDCSAICNNSQTARSQSENKVDQLIARPPVERTEKPPETATGASANVEKKTEKVCETPTQSASAVSGLCSTEQASHNAENAVRALAESLKGSKVLVTGVHHFVGRRVAELAAALGFQVVCPCGSAVGLVLLSTF